MPINEETRQTGGDAPTNPQVGKKLGISYSMVSRLRNGERYPSIKVMRQIRDQYSWPMREQLELIPDGGRDHRWADEFEQRIRKAAG